MPGGVSKENVEYHAEDLAVEVTIQLWKIISKENWSIYYHVKSRSFGRNCLWSVLKHELHRLIVENLAIREGKWSGKINQDSLQ